MPKPQQACEWREIPGFNGYEVNRMGEVRSYRSRFGRSSAPKLLTPYKKQPRGRNRRSSRVCVKLIDGDGKAREVPVVSIVVDVWRSGRPPGMVAYHINGDPADNCAMNIGFITNANLGKRTGGNSRRIPVVKVNPDGEVVEAYRSAREAARQNHMSYQAVLDRCKNRVKKPFALDGHTYQYDD